jgi:tetratricopeptide (TPR) repeat protein
MKRPASLQGYTTREVARLLETTPRQVRSLVAAGFLTPRRGPRREFRFSFQDLVVLRAAQGLRRARIPPRRVRSALARLVEQLPRGRSLAAVRIAAEGGEIVVHDGREAWEPESGQRVLDFEVAELAAAAAPLAHRAAREAHERADDLDAEDWYELGCELEVAAPAEAAAAYRRALEQAPDHPDAHLNLGRLLHEEGRLDEAEQRYRRAAALRPGDPTAVFNLGVALQDRGHPADAAAAYRRVLAADPGYADAHYNLAVVSEALGDRGAAIQHLKSYRDLVIGRRR